MDFGLSDEQELLQETLRGFIANECPPTRLREIFDASSGGAAAALWSGLAEMGVTGLVVPEQYGGAGMELLDLALVAEILGEGALPGPFEGHALVCLALALAGSPEQREYWLPKLASGESIGTLACCEQEGQWFPPAWTLSSSGERLRGGKLFVPHADVADLLLVGMVGGRFALVESGAQGLAIRDMDGIDRTRPIFRVDFEDTPYEQLAANATLAERVCDAGLVLAAADSFGAASRLIDQCVAYAGAREQFGRKIGEFQAVKHQIARLGTEVEPTRGLYWYAAYAWDHLPAEASRSAALAKAHITDRAMDAARMAVELHGGIGFTWECDVQMWFKRAMFNRAFFGTPEWLRERCATLAGW